MITKISLIGLSIIIMLAIGIASGSILNNCKVVGIFISNPISDTPLKPTIYYTIESDQLTSHCSFYIELDSNSNNFYANQEMASLLRDAFFNDKYVSIESDPFDKSLSDIENPNSQTAILAVGCITPPESSANATELRRTVATGGLTSKINNPNNGAMLSSKISTGAKLLNNTNSIGVIKGLRNGPALNPQPMPPGISSE